MSKGAAALQFQMFACAPSLSDTDVDRLDANRKEDQDRGVPGRMSNVRLGRGRCYPADHEGGEHLAMLRCYLPWRSAE